MAARSSSRPSSCCPCRRRAKAIPSGARASCSSVLDSWRGTPRPNAEPGFGLPEVFASLSDLVGRTVPDGDREALDVVAFWKKHGPLPRAPWLLACTRTRAALGQGRALSAYLTDLARHVAADKETP